MLRLNTLKTQLQSAAILDDRPDVAYRMLCVANAEYQRNGYQQGHEEILNWLHWCLSYLEYRDQFSEMLWFAESDEFEFPSASPSYHQVNLALLHFSPGRWIRVVLGNAMRAWATNSNKRHIECVTAFLVDLNEKTRIDRTTPELLKKALLNSGVLALQNEGAEQLERELQAYLFFFEPRQWLSLHSEKQKQVRRSAQAQLQRAQQKEWVKWFKAAYPNQAAHFDRVISNITDPDMED